MAVSASVAESDVSSCADVAEVDDLLDLGGLMERPPSEERPFARMVVL